MALDRGKGMVVTLLLLSESERDSLVPKQAIYDPCCRALSLVYFVTALRLGNVQEFFDPAQTSCSIHSCFTLLCMSLDIPIPSAAPK
jgi:hypothetical protein